MTGIRVLVVDDHPVVRRGLEAVLAIADGITVVGSATGGREGVAMAAELAPDVVLMDLSMPDLDGVAATRAVMRAAEPGDRSPNIVVLTSYAEESRVLAAIDAGARGYLLKHSTPEAVVDAVRAAARGGVPLDPLAARALVDRAAAPVSARDLSPREREVLDLVADGLANKQIARRLAISERTVKAHLTAVFQVLGVTDRTQAALWRRDHP